MLRRFSRVCSVTELLCVAALRGTCHQHTRGCMENTTAFKLEEAYERGSPLAASQRIAAALC